MRITNKEYLGIILSDKDNNHQGRYKVYIPQLQPHMQKDKGIWAKNHINDYRISPSQDGVYGSYLPLHSGTQVIVKFFSSQFESAYIDRIVSDHNNESMPFKIIDRDDYYQLLRTPKYNHLIALCEDTETGGASDTSKSIHIYCNNKKITLVMNDSGLNIDVTEGNMSLRSVGATYIQNTEGDINIKVAGCVNIQSDADINIKSSGDCNIESDGNLNIKSSGDCNIESDGATNIKAGSLCNIDATSINLNCGLSAESESADEAEDAEDPSLINTNNEFKYYQGNDGTVVI